jgi:regulator of sirC expression with transglutaminase-like and TPR domain
VTTPPDRLTSVLADPDRRLDRLLAAVAAVASDAPTEAGIVTAFDQLAEPLSDGRRAAPRPETVLSYVHGELGFVGNTTDYYNPSNSLIHRVLRRRKGIPLTLAAVSIEIGRRVDVDLTLVGLPGHVVLGDGSEPDRWFDPFGAGAELDIDACRTLFSRFNPIETFDPLFLRPMERTAIATRMLNNLKVCYRSRSDLSKLAKTLELSISIPGALVSERHEFAVVLAALGREELAAEQRELLIGLDPERADAHRRAARKHRARRN